MAKPKETPAEASKPKLTKAQRFHALALKRLRKAFKMLDLIGNLGAYKPTVEQQRAVVDALTSRVARTARALGDKLLSEEIPIPE